jgi:hypothetical protein
LSSQNLVCSSAKCDCEATKFWNGTTCFPKRIYNESCAGTYQCDDSKNLTCLSSICQCTNIQYYTDDKCYLSKLFSETCSSTIECLNNMTCLGNKCDCTPTDYYDSVSKSCLTRKTFQESCSGDQCMTASSLYCNLGLAKCDCDSTSFWNDTNCILKKIYGEFCSASF